jgi:hypothetical protein
VGVLAIGPSRSFALRQWILPGSVPGAVVDNVIERFAGSGR